MSDFVLRRRGKCPVCGQEDNKQQTEQEVESLRRVLSKLVSTVEELAEHWIDFGEPLERTSKSAKQRNVVRALEEAKAALEARQAGEAGGDGHGR